MPDETPDLPIQTGVIQPNQYRRLPREGAHLNQDELSAMSNLAWAVKQSKQNVGRRLLDYADSVIKITERLKK